MVLFRNISTGWVAYINGYEINEINMPWGWGYSYEKNLAEGRVPDEKLLTAVRYAAAVQFILAIAIFFVLCRNLFNRPVAYLATFYLTMNPTVLLDGRRSVMESPHLLFMMLVLLSGSVAHTRSTTLSVCTFRLIGRFRSRSKTPQCSDRNISIHLVL